MFRQAINNLKRSNIVITNFKLKSIAIPSILMGSIFYHQMKAQMSHKIMKLEENFKRLSLQDCVNMQEGEMKEVKYGSKDNESILVVMYAGKLRALSNYCPHFGAPLVNGVLIDNVVKCPWHGASFDIVTGETDISPSIDNLPIYEVLSDETGLYVNLPENVKHSVTPKMSKRDPNDHRRFVIIGGGPAGLSAAETLRQSGYTGELTMISKDAYVPYDRTLLSKFIPGDVTKIYLRSPDFLKEYDIMLQNDVSVISVDNQARQVKLSNGEVITYDKLLVATGGSAVVPNIPGSTNSNVFTLRTYDDLIKIKNASASAKDIVIIGASFIGMESASMLKKTFPNANVTVIDRSITPFQSTLGTEIGAALQK